MRVAFTVHLNFQVLVKLGDYRGRVLLIVHPLWAFLKTKNRPAWGAIEWNLTKFLIGRDGRIEGRFPPTTTPDALAPQVEKLLAV